MQMVRDHTFAQLTAMVADVRGSMMQPISGSPTRNFQAGIILAKNMKKYKRCPRDINELIEWCENNGLMKGGLEGLNSIKYWPQIIKKYSIPLHDSSMLNLLYISIYGSSSIKKVTYSVMTQSRELTNYCQESVRPTHSRRIAEALNTLDNPKSLDLIVKSVFASKNTLVKNDSSDSNYSKPDDQNSNYILAMKAIESIF